MSATGNETRHTRRKQPAIPLSKERIVTTAMRLIEERGAKAFSMRALANELGVFPTALVWHVGDRDKLLTAISARWKREMVMPEAIGDWKNCVREMARRYREAAHRQPNVAQLIRSEFVNDTAEFGLPEAFVAGVTIIGLPDDEIVCAYNALIVAVVGFVDLELTRLPNKASGSMHDIERAVRSVDPQRFPHLHGYRDRLADRAIWLKWTSGIEAPLDESFDYLIELLIAGIGRRLEPEHTISNAPRAELGLSRPIGATRRSERPRQRDSGAPPTTRPVR